MLARLRDHAPVLGLAVLAAFLVGSGAVGVHAAHDAESLPIAVEHDASAHRFDAAQETAGGHRLDCLACGWSRSLRPAADTVFVAGASLEAGAVLRADAVVVLTPTRAARPPLRAPPSPVRT